MSCSTKIPKTTRLTAHQALRDVNPANLDKIPSSENGPSLSISDPHRPAPFFETNISDYLYGPAAESQPGREISGSNQTILREKIYGFWVERERGVVVSALIPARLTEAKLTGRTCGTGRT